MTGGFAFTGLFLEGLLSFFTPCVLPLVPLYMAYLIRDTSREGEKPSRMRTFLYTIAFVLGICTVFFLAGLTSGFLHDFFTKNEIVFQLVGGIVLLFMGLVSLNVIRIPFLQNTYSANQRFEGKMTPFKAWLTGFFFSFAWSPCIGPMLAQAILLASSAENKLTGFLYIASYALGFISIFVLLGLFTEEVLRFLKEKRNIVKYTGILSGVIVAGMGCWMLMQAFTRISVMNAVVPAETQPQEQSDEGTAEGTDEGTEEGTAKETDMEKYGFTLKDGQGNSHTLSEYKGRTVLLNFFGTWCHYCNLELPDLQEVHENDKNVEIILIAAPGLNGEGTMEQVEKTMKSAGYTMTILYDTSYQVTNMYQVSGYPTTYVFKKDGNFLGYIPGYLPKDGLMDVLKQAEEAN